MSANLEEVEATRRAIESLDAEIAHRVDRRNELARKIAEQRGSVYSGAREAEMMARAPYPEVTAALMRTSKTETTRHVIAERRAPVLRTQHEASRGSFVVVAGPCSAESPEQLEESALALRAMGIRRMRAGCWKPRTRPDGFQGHGVAALEWMRDACDRHSLELWTEVRDVATTEASYRAKIDVAWIGARNAQNFELLSAVGRRFPKVALKRGAGCTVEEWLAAAEYVEAGGARVVLVERGLRTFDPSFRNIVDLAGAIWAKQLSGREVLVDVSHGTGIPALAVPLAAAAKAAGLDGVMVEAHPRPRESVTDAAQALSFGELGGIVHVVA